MQSQPPVDVHGVGDGVPALQADDRQCVDWQLAGKHGQEPGRAAAGPRLPAGGMVVVLVAGVEVHEGNQHQVEPHAQVGKGQVAHEESWDGQLVAADEQEDQDGQVTGHSEDRDEPGEAAQEGEAQQVLTGVERIRHRRAHYERPAMATKF